MKIKDGDNMPNIQEMTTAELEQFVRGDCAARVDEKDTDFLFAVLEELDKRKRAEKPVEAAAADIRQDAWWRLVNGEISQAEYRETVLFTAMSEDERKTLDEEFIPRYISQAVKCQADLDVEHRK